ncbi:MAG: bactofilin family protein [Bacteroidota bacterium]
MNKVDSVKELNMIAAGTTVEGKIRTQGSVRVDGKVVGEISASEAVAVGHSGEVEGNVTAKNVTVGGKVRGSLNIAEKAVLEGKAVVRGDLRAARLVIDEGALFDGKVSMSDKAQSFETKH